MKKLSKLMLSLLAVLFIAAMIKVPSYAYYDSYDKVSLTQTYAAANGCTVTWTTPTFSGSNTISTYYLTTGGYIDSSGSNVTLVGQYNSTVRQGWVNLTADYTGTIYLSCRYKYGSTWYYHDLTYAAINTVPSTPAVSNFYVDYVSSSNGVEFKVDRPNSNYKSQIYLYQNYNPVGMLTFNTYSDYTYCASNIAYRYCARYYYTNPDNKVTYAGSWSGFRAFDIPYFYGKAKSNKKGFTMKIKKGTGVAYYNLYVNDRFVKKLSTKKAAQTFTIKKGYTKKRSNTIKLVPFISNYGASDVYKSGSLYIWK